ncbi:MAG: PhoH family protein [Verrucomicrobiales bacterium]|jgi:phosphate starvation-inducible PhoH-like protein|nr:PhoH family protein [Verrucomicrobiales bacterium]MBP9224245.1 PhoH family protein [Verrucomicrobiales bacterium]
MAETTLEFESPHFLHGLFADDLSLLKEMGTLLGLTVTTRDSWIKFEGDEASTAAGVAVMEDLEQVRRKGGVISSHTFRYAVKTAAESMASSALKDGAKVTDLFNRRLLGSGSKPAVSPRSKNQLKYLQALDQHDVVFGIGPAGTGKTYLAMAYALDLLKNRKIDRIMLTRPAVEAGEALGFLPGALEEKVLPYLRPLYDAMSDMLDGADSMKFAEKNLIEIAPLAYMRGRTLNRACVILDEAQNATREQMFMFLTRLGEGAKCIVTGDPSQIDLRPKARSGLLEAMNVLHGVDGIAFSRFDTGDVVRHPVVARIISAYEQGRSEEMVRESSANP